MEIREYFEIAAGMLVLVALAFSFFDLRGRPNHFDIDDMKYAPSAGWLAWFAATFGTVVFVSLEIIELCVIH